MMEVIITFKIKRIEKKSTSLKRTQYTKGNMIRKTRKKMKYFFIR